MHHKLCKPVLILLFIIFSSAVARAQAPGDFVAESEIRIDRIKAELDSLRARLDSLMDHLDERVDSLEREKEERELEKLFREAERLGQKGKKKKEIDQFRKFRSGARQLQALNPNISVGSDVLGAVFSCARWILISWLHSTRSPGGRFSPQLTARGISTLTRPTWSGSTCPATST